jgi:hypothetical protein
MPRYRVTVQRATIEIVEAANPYMAAALASERDGDGAMITDVRPAVGRVPATSKKTAKKAAKKRRPLSPEARARLAENLKKARAARARNLRTAKKATAKKKTTKKTKRVAKRR